MRDSRSEPHGPERLPTDQPPPNPTDVGNQPALRYGASSRWIVPAAVLSAVAIGMFAISFSLQWLLPVIGIVYVLVLFVAMIAAARAHAAPRLRNRRLAWLMAALAAGALLVFIGIYVVETLAGSAV